MSDTLDKMDAAQAEYEAMKAQNAALQQAGLQAAFERKAAEMKQAQEGAKLTPLARRPNQLLQFFTYGHLPPHLQDVSKLFGELAMQLEALLPANPEGTVAFRKLLEAKDCAVRAVLFKS